MFHDFSYNIRQQQNVLSYFPLWNFHHIKVDKCIQTFGGECIARQEPWVGCIRCVLLYCIVFCLPPIKVSNTSYLNKYLVYTYVPPTCLEFATFYIFVLKELMKCFWIVLSKPLFNCNLWKSTLFCQVIIIQFSVLIHSKFLSCTHYLLFTLSIWKHVFIPLTSLISDIYYMRISSKHAYHRKFTSVNGSQNQQYKLKCFVEINAILFQKHDFKSLLFVNPLCSLDFYYFCSQSQFLSWYVEMINLNINLVV